MNNQIITSPQQALGLARILTEKNHAVSQYNQNLLDDLHHLGLSFQDEGYEELTNYHRKTQEQLEVATAEIKVLVHRLQEIASLLQQGQQYL